MNRRKTALLFVCLMLLAAIALTACGSKDAQENDPNLGVWNAATGEALGLSADISEFFGSGFSIELKSGGKCTISVDGETASGKWTLEDGAFTVSGGGIDCSGTLKNGSLVLDDVLGMGLKISFEKEGGSPAGAVQKPAVQKPGAQNEGVAGVWIGKTVTLPGEEPSDSFMGMMDVPDVIYLELKADGAVRLQYIGEFVDTTWEKNGNSAGTIDFEGTPVQFELLDGELHLYIGEKGGAESVEYTLVPSDKSFDELSGGAAPDASGADSAMNSELAAYDHPEHIVTFEGDWYGIIYFEEGFGFWEGVDGGMLNVVARFAFRDGRCEAFLATEMEPGDEDFNFQNINARIGTNGLAISGTLFDMEFENTLVREFEGESAMMYLDTDDNGDGFYAVLYLRPWGEAWNESDPWAPSDDNVEYVAESTFEEITEILGGDISQIPVPTSIAGREAGGGLNGEKPLGGTGGGKESSIGGGDEAAAARPEEGEPSDAAIEKYSLDPLSKDRQAMSADRLTKAELSEKYALIIDTDTRTIDYADVVAMMGIEPSAFWFYDDCRIFDWRAKESEDLYVRVMFKLEDGRWLNYSFSTNV